MYIFDNKAVKPSLVSLYEPSRKPPRMTQPKISSNETYLQGRVGREIMTDIPDTLTPQTEGAGMRRLNENLNKVNKHVNTSKQKVNRFISLKL